MQRLATARSGPGRHFLTEFLRRADVGIHGLAAALGLSPKVILVAKCLRDGGSQLHAHTASQTRPFERLCGSTERRGGGRWPQIGRFGEFASGIKSEGEP